MYDTQSEHAELALLVGLERPGHDKWALQDSLLELRELAESAGVSVLDTVTQKRNVPCAPTFIGSGKATELAARCKETNVNTVVFDDDLSPAQGRNLGEILGEKIKVLDRTELILDIFAQRARTREGKIQVELAQLQYMLPRLTGLWTHLSRQRGGVGCRGPGEQQLEVDRRRIQEKLGHLERDLEEVRKNRRIERGGRQKLHWPRVSLIGYTNSGKSTLMNALTGAGVLAEDKLFATLDPTTRKLRLPNNQNVLLSDTVGFLRKLPHLLVEAFKATLEEVVEADLLLHVVDVSHPKAHEQIAAVEVVLKEIGAWGKPTIIALNKIDRLGALEACHSERSEESLSSGPASDIRPRSLDKLGMTVETGPADAEDETSPTLRKFRREFPDAVLISAKEGTNLDGLRHEMVNRLRDRRVEIRLSIPASRASTIALVYRSGHVLARGTDEDRVLLTAQVPRVLADELAPYIVTGETADGN